MPRTIVRPRSRVPQWLIRLFSRLLPWVLLALGIALFFASVTPEVRRVDTVRFDGELEPGAVTGDALNRSGYAFAVVSFETRPSCALRVYVLDDALAKMYKSSGSLPDPIQSLNCDRTQAVVRADIVLLVFQNARDERAEPYAVSVDLFVESLPYGLLAFPAMAAFISGAAILIFGVFGRGLEKIANEFLEKDTTPRKREQDDGKRLP